jgi:hypothetical protein
MVSSPSAIVEIGGRSSPTICVVFGGLTAFFFFALRAILLPFAV